MAKKKDIRILRKLYHGDGKMTVKDRSDYRKKLIKELETQFNRFIRSRDCPGICISCTNFVTTDTCDAGHFWRVHYSALRFDERNVNAQCRGCNNWKSGNENEYRLGMVAKYGEDVVTELDTNRNNEWSWDIDWLEEQIETYKQKINERS